MTLIIVISLNLISKTLISGNNYLKSQGMNFAYNLISRTQILE